MDDPATQAARLHRAMSAPLPSCCAYHASQLPTGCQQGDQCPARAAARAIRDAADDTVPNAETVSGWLPYFGLILAIVGAVAAYVFVIFADWLPWPGL